MFSRFSIFLAVVRQLFDSSVAGVESDLCGGLFVEEHIAQDFYIAELAHGELSFAELSGSIEY